MLCLMQGNLHWAITAKHTEPTINDTMACVWLASQLILCPNEVHWEKWAFLSQGSMQIQDTQHLMMLEVGSHNR